MDKTTPHRSTSVPNLRGQKNEQIWTFTFGCKVNAADSDQMEGFLKSTGASLNQKNVPPDSIVINTCTVTSQADAQARQLIRKMNRLYPEAKMVVSGCYAERDPAALKTLPGVVKVLPIAQQKTIGVALGLTTDVATPMAYTQKTRAVLKIQDGCNAYCSFCVLPFVRGRSASLNISDILSQAKSFSEQNYQELVITGTHMGAFGRDLEPRTNFPKLIKKILEVAPQAHVRISSLEPTTLTPEFIRLVENEKKIVPHFHIPLQSGSDAVLRRMNRKYKVKNYAERVLKLSLTKPLTSIGTDVIVGFPGETQREFDETVNLIQSLPLTYLHVFPFSARPETKAAKLKDDVLGNIKNERVHVLRDLSHQKRKAYFENFKGTVQTVLVEKKKTKEGLLMGYTEHYVPVQFKGQDRLIEKGVDVKLTDLVEAGQDQLYYQAEVV